MNARNRLGPLVAAAIVLCTGARAHAHATLHIRNQDGPGEGFNDPTPLAPSHGNKGTTLGAQRLAAVQFAAEMWGEILDSDVTIEVDANFDPLGCTSGAAVLAHAAANSIASGISTEGADSSLSYPQPLAERLSRANLNGTQPDIVAVFNTSIDDPSCMGGLGWFYGLDAGGGNLPDVANTALHEFAHGLGVTEFADSQTGAPLGGVPDAYSTFVLDSGTGKRLDQMTDAERLAAAADVRKVVWLGPRVTSNAAQLLLKGSPALSVSPMPSGFSGIVSDASFESRPPKAMVSGPLAIANPVDGCTLGTDVAGKVVLYRPACQPSDIAAFLAQQGALGALMVISATRDSPPLPLEEPGASAVALPVLSITDADATLLQTAVGSGSVNAQLTADPAQGLGADAMGRVMLDATEPSTSDSLSHWDVLARPNLLMEPIATPPQPNDVDLTAPMLLDLGWAPFCGNGRIDQQEACDDGSQNSDTKADACRTDCTQAHCGDGVKDTNEACDSGKQNSDTAPNACRTDCTQARCGDGVKDKGEQCDSGPKNSDSVKDACRTDCTLARCGDGVKDGMEGCDDGNANSDSMPDACRTNCTAARCGDGVKDTNETCDDGAANSDSVPDACRTNCMPAHCGDGIKDTGEACDDGSGNCTRCSAKPTSPGAVGTASDDAGLPKDGGQAGANTHGSHASCHCAVPGLPRRSRSAWGALLFAAAALTRVRRRRAKSD